MDEQAFAIPIERNAPAEVASRASTSKQSSEPFTLWGSLD
jgi:hypothetical protein